MKTAKWYVYRATMFLGTISAAFLIVGQTAKRW